jgi:hypothetical protein
LDDVDYGDIVLEDMAPVPHTCSLMADGRGMLGFKVEAQSADRWLLIHDIAEHRRELDGALPPGEIGSVPVTPVVGRRLSVQQFLELP